MENNSKMVNGKVVVVSGAGGGIGRDIALLMAANGARWWSTTSAPR